MTLTTEMQATMTAPLTALDRCDRCGAAAKARVALEIGEPLMFCGHHFRQNEFALREVALAIYDELGD